MGGGVIPMGANGALQYNNNGIFGGLPLGTSAQVLFGNASGAPTWGSPPGGDLSTLTGLGAGVKAALALPLDGTGALCAQTGCTLTNPIIHNPTIDGGTWANPTFTGTITGLPGVGTCTDKTGAPLAHCVASSVIFNEEPGTDPVPGGTGFSIAAHTASTVMAWDVFEGAGRTVAEAEMDARTQVVQARKNMVSMQEHIQQIANQLRMKLK